MKYATTIAVVGFAAICLIGFFCGVLLGLQFDLEWGKYLGRMEIVSMPEAGLLDICARLLRDGFPDQSQSDACADILLNISQRIVP